MLVFLLAFLAAAPSTDGLFGLNPGVAHASEVRSSPIRHEFAQSKRPGRSRAQIRAVLDARPRTREEWKAIARDLASKHAAGGAYLVQFFDHPSALEGWDGSGLLRDADWPHWLGRATVDADDSGRLYGRTFEPAKDLETGLDRVGVLK